MYEQEAVFLINNKNLTSFGNYEILACSIKPPVMVTLKQILLVKNMMTVVDLFIIERLL